MGAVLAGSKTFIARANTFRRMLGGGLRQSGIMAAAGLVALQTMRERLSDDHRRTYQLWERLRQSNPALVGEAPQTNILQVFVPEGEQRTARDWENECSAQQLAVRAAGKRTLRLVIHRHITDDDIETASQIIAEIAAKC